MITTKKGKAGKASVSYSGNARYAGTNHLPDLMNSYQFANYFNEGSINGGGKAIFDEDTMERIQQYMNGQNRGGAGKRDENTSGYPGGA